MALVWERIETKNSGNVGNVTKLGVDEVLVYAVRRAKVPGGWLVAALLPYQSSGITFYPDPNHSWAADEKQ